MNINLKYFLYALISFFLIFSFNMLFLYKCGELESLENVVLQQEKENNLFGPAIGFDEKKYKHLLLQKHKPTIVAVGSSRAMPVHRMMFLESFVNLSRTVVNISDAPIIMKQIADIGTVKEVLFFVDFWWFHPKHCQKQLHFKHTVRNIFLYPFIWMSDKKINISQMLQCLLNLHKSKNIGLQANILNDGYDFYGYYYLDSFINGPKISEVRKDWDKSFPTLSKDIFLEPSRNIHQEAITLFQKAMSIASQNSIRVTIIFPPMSPRHTTYTNKNIEFEYIQKIKKMLINDYGGFDFHSAESYKGNINEFRDDSHASVIAYAKMLKIICNQKRYRDFINIKSLEKIINHETKNKMRDLRREDFFKYTENKL